MSLADDIRKITGQVTKEWTKQRKAEERGRRSSHSREYIYSDRVYFTEVADAILPGAYAHASGNGKYSVSKRQLYYACREAFQQRTDRELEYKYFASTLLVQYLNRHPTEQSAWKLTADPRGNLTIPNTGKGWEKRVPVGTIDIDNYLREAGVDPDPYDDTETTILSSAWPSVAAGVRYQAVLYIEKEGFGPLLQEARIAERFSLAVMSCKGQSVVAARRFVDEVCAEGSGVPLLVVHDFDKAGFEIAQRLTTVSEWAEDNDRITYEFQNEIDVIDLGLRLADVEKYKPPVEHCRFKGYFASDSIATEEEKAFLRSGRRVELNALTAPQFIEWLEAKLVENLPQQFLPGDDVLEDAYRRALAIAEINRAIEEAREEAIATAREAKVPKSLKRKLAKAMKESSQPWDQVLYDLAEERIQKLHEEG